MKKAWLFGVPFLSLELTCYAETTQWEIDPAHSKPETCGAVVGDEAALTLDVELIKKAK